MAFIELLTDEEADGPAAGLFAADLQATGYVANFTRLFARRPAVFQAWAQLNKAIKANMDARVYELATLAAARTLRSSYCALAHGTVLRDRFYDADTVAAIATDHRGAGLGPADVAVMDFAAKVAADASSVGVQDITALREAGLTDDDIFDVTLAAAARCFFSTVLDATGTEPDASYRTRLEPALREALTVGRPIAATAEQRSGGEPPLIAADQVGHVGEA